MRLLSAKRIFRQVVTVLLPLLLLVSGVTYFHWRGIQPGNVFLPVDLARNIRPWQMDSLGPLQNWLISDPLYQFYPFLTQVVESARQGDLFLWSPNIFLGHPASGDPLFAVFYPFPVIAALVLGVERGFTMSLYLHVILAALFTYGLLRSYRLTRAAAVAGAFTYALSGYMITWLETPFWINTMAWFPAVLWAYNRALTTWQWRYMGVGGAALGVAFLAGNFQFMVVFLALILLLGIGYTVQLRSTTGSMSWWPIGSAMSIVSIGFLIGAVQILPFAEFLPLTRRNVVQGLNDPLALPQIVTLLLPNFFGNPTQGSYSGAGNYSEATFYFGVVAMLLALLGIGAKPRLWPILLAASTAAVVYFALGGPGVAIFSQIPLIRNASLHRSLFILPLLIGWLAAIALSQPSLSRKWATLIAVTLALLSLSLTYLPWAQRPDASADLRANDVLVTLALLFAAWIVLLIRPRGAQWRGAADWVLAGLIFVNLFWYGSAFNPSGKIRNLMPETGTIDYLRDNADGERVVALQRGDMLIGPNLLSISGVMEPGGYSSLVSPRLHALIERDDPTIDLPWASRALNTMLFSYPSTRFLDLTSVRFLVSPEEIFDPGPVGEFVANDCSMQLGPLSVGMPITGTFEVWRTAINRIDFRFAPNSVPSDPIPLHFRLWRDSLEGKQIADNQFTLNADGATLQTTVYFSPEENAPGRTYAWELARVEPGDHELFLCADGAGIPALSIYGAQLAEINHTEDVRIYRRFAPFYRASVVYGVEYVPDDEQAMTRLLDEDFDLRNTAIASIPIALPTRSATPATEAVVEHYTNKEVQIRVNARQAGLLVLTDHFYPGWVATVDGQPVEILRVNHVMRGVPLPPGEHQITFAYQPTTVYAGAIMSAIGLMLALALIIQPRLRKR